MKNRPTIKNLSKYTIARHCCDLTDVEAGITELKEHIALREKCNIKVPDSVYIRLFRLGEKAIKIGKKEK